MSDCHQNLTSTLYCTFSISDDFRMFAGDLGNEVTDETLTRVFSKFSSFVKAKVVRDKKTNKTKGYGFVSFRDPNDFARAMREMNGKLINVYILDPFLLGVCKSVRDYSHQEIS